MRALFSILVMKSRNKHWEFQTTKCQKPTSFLLFKSLNAMSAKSFCGTSFPLGSIYDMPIKICFKSHGGIISSASCSQGNSVKTNGTIYEYEFYWRWAQIVTLHIGATKIAPSHSEGCFKCIFKATAPPIDCPNKKHGSFLKSWHSALQIHQL